MISVDISSSSNTNQPSSKEVRMVSQCLSATLTTPSTTSSPSSCLSYPLHNGMRQHRYYLCLSKSRRSQVVCVSPQEDNISRRSPLHFPTVQSTSSSHMVKEIKFLREHMGSIHHLWDFERQLYHSSSLSYLMPSLRNEEYATSGVVDNPINVELCDAISLAKEALSASKLALSLADSSDIMDADFDESPSPRSIDNLKVKQTVRSTRLLERKTKRRKFARPRAVHEADSPVKEPPRGSKEGIDHNDPLRLFLWGPETKQLLTLEEEKTLIREIQDFDKFAVAKEQLHSQFGREPTVSEWANAVGLSSGTLRLKHHCWKKNREKMIYSNFRMVVYIAKQYQGRGLSLQDLMQEGSMGLMKSVEKFKPQAGCRFPSYAYWWIRHSIKKAIFQHSRTIRVPENMYSLFGKVLEAKKLCIQEGIHSPTNEDLATRVGITVERLHSLLSVMRYPLSMQQPVWADQATTFQEVTADTKVENPGISVERQLMRKHIRNLLCILNQREQKIVKLRYGIGSTTEKRYSLTEIGVMLGLSKERIRQLESRALNKLKESLSSHGLKSYTELLM